jgi:hypothetical protein
VRRGGIEEFLAAVVFWALVLFLLTGLYHMYGKPLAGLLGGVS